LEKYVFTLLGPTHPTLSNAGVTLRLTNNVDAKGWKRGIPFCRSSSSESA